MILENDSDIEYEARVQKKIKKEREINRRNLDQVDHQINKCNKEIARLNNDPDVDQAIRMYIHLCYPDARKDAIKNVEFYTKHAKLRAIERFNIKLNTLHERKHLLNFFSPKP